MFHVEHLTFLKAIVNACKLLIQIEVARGVFQSRSVHNALFFRPVEYEF